MAGEGDLKFNIGFGGVDIESVKKAWAEDEKAIQKEIARMSKLKVPIDSTNIIALNKRLETTEALLKRINSMQNKSTGTKPLTSVQAENLNIKATNTATVASSKANLLDADAKLKNAKASKIIQDSQLKVEASTRKATAATNSHTAAWNAQRGVLNGMPQLLNSYLSVLGGMRLISRIREVTAEFELQKVALGAILQDKAKADKLFAQITQLAVQSPFQVKELVTYTKELAAYRIETESLFDTTKRLADISAGLGVDMGRLILAYGQVSAASVLRGQELRQFTEAGIPLVSLLADKFSLLRGEMVSTGEVFDLISDRAVSFGMVKEVFEDMTNAGGIFYNMQEIQAQTLAGSWSNLRDEIDLAFNAMGQDNYGVIKGVIDLTKDLVRNWEKVVSVIGAVAIGYGSFRVTMALMNASQTKLITSTILLKNAKKSLAVTENILDKTRISAIRTLKAAEVANNSYAIAITKASLATNVFARSWYNIKALFISNIWGLAIAGIAALSTWLYNAYQNSNKLNKELSKIESEGLQRGEGLVRNFKRLTETVISSTDGTKKQKEALSELNRTYGDTIPIQYLTIDGLKSLKGNYEEVTNAIYDKIKAQIEEKKISTLQAEYTDKLAGQSDSLKKYLVDVEKISKEDATAIVDEFSRQVNSGFIKMGDAVKDNLEKINNIVLAQSGKALRLGKTYSANIFSKEFWSATPVAANQEWTDLGKTLEELTDKQNNITESASKSYTMYGFLATKAKDAFSELENIGSRTKEQIEETYQIKFNTEFEVNERNLNDKIKFLSEFLINNFNYYFKGNAVNLEDVLTFLSPENMAKADKQTQALAIPFTKLANDIKKEINNMSAAPSTSLIEGAFKRLLLSTKLTMDDVSQYLKGNEESYKDYSNKVQSYLEEVLRKQSEMSTYNAEYDKQVSKGGGAGVLSPKYTQEQIDKNNELSIVLKAIVDLVNNLTNIRTHGDDADKRLSALNQEISLVERVYSEYQKLSDHMGSEDARKEVERLFGVLDKASGKMKVVGTRFEMATSTQQLQEFYEDASKAAKALPKSQKAVMEINFKDSKTGLDEVSRDLKDRLSKLQSEIDQQQKANKFFESMLGLTGDQKLAASLTVGIYGAGFEDTAGMIKEQLTKAFEGIDIQLELGGDVIDYAGLLKRVPELEKKEGKERADAAKKFALEGIQQNSDYIINLYKSLDKYQEYEARRIQIAQKAANDLIEIEKSTTIPEKEKPKAKAAIEKKKKQDIAKLSFEEFKGTEDYAEIFANLDRVGTTAISNLIEKLNQFKSSAGKDLDTTSFKELIQALEKLKEQQEKRDPFTAIKDSITEYKDAVMDMSTFSTAVDIAENNKKLAKTEEGLAIAEEDLAYAKDAHAKAETRLRSAQQKVIMGVQQIKSDFDAVSGAVTQSLDLVQQLMEGMGITFDEETQAAVDAFAKGIGLVGAALGIVITVLIAIEVLGAKAMATLLPLLAAGIALGAIFFFAGAKTRKANREIERQGEIVKSLKNAYDDLTRSIENSVGEERFLRTGEQANNLYKQQIALLKQAEAERSKKKPDKSAVSEYERQAELINQQIEDLFKGVKDEVMGGTAKDFASTLAEAMFGALADGKNAAIAAWDEATDQIINNLILKMVSIKLIEPRLQKLVDELYTKIAPPDTTDLRKKQAELESKLDVAKRIPFGLGKDSARKYQKQLDEINKQIKEAEDKGFNLDKDAFKEFREGVGILGEDIYGVMDALSDVLKIPKDTGLTGIAKNIASASEDQITGLAAGINTQNGYFARTVVSSEGIYVIMQKWDAEKSGESGIGTAQLIGIQNSALLQLQAINSNTLNTVGELKLVNEKLDRVIKPRGVPATHTVKTELV